MNAIRPGLRPALHRLASGLRGLMAGLVLLAGLSTARAQWLTQTNVLKPGWSAIYLYVDAAIQSLDSLAEGTPIDQIWLWKSPRQPRTVHHQPGH
jgi:hypothetical protein